MQCLPVCTSTEPVFDATNEAGITINVGGQEMDGVCADDSGGNTCEQVSGEVPISFLTFRVQALICRFSSDRWRM